MRGTGKTTEQIKNAPIGAMFVWCNDRTEYAKDLADKLGRPDLKIVGPAVFDNQFVRLKGLELSGLVVDHAATAFMDKERLRNYFEAMLWATTRVGGKKK